MSSSRSSTCVTKVSFKSSVFGHKGINSWDSSTHDYKSSRNQQESMFAPLSKHRRNLVRWPAEGLAVGRHRRPREDLSGSWEQQRISGFIRWWIKWHNDVMIRRNVSAANCSTIFAFNAMSVGMLFTRLEFEWNTFSANTPCKHTKCQVNHNLLNEVQNHPCVRQKSLRHLQ